MATSTIQSVALYVLKLPLHTPYRLSYHTFTEFEPIIVVVRDNQGRTGFGEGHISPGSSQETRAGGWSFCEQHAATLIGQSVLAGKAAIRAAAGASPVAATAIVSALEMLEDHPLLQVNEPVRLPLLTAFNAQLDADIDAEIEQRLALGFKTFKLKVGTGVEADLRRVQRIQQALAGRATLRIDANRGYSKEEGCRFASRLDPVGIELFEQPCAAEDWDANAAVAAIATVPLMLDEPICALADIERAATIHNVGLCKLKLKRFGSLDALAVALRRVRELGMEPVLGDGLSSEPTCWMEACVARSTVSNAGEFNGFLKPKIRLFTEPLKFFDGELYLAPGRPRLNQQTIDELMVRSLHY